MALGSGRVRLMSRGAVVLDRFEKAFISFRIGTPQWLRDERFGELLGLFEKYKGVTDEITFFTAETHAPLPLGEMARRAEILSRRMEAARKRGYRSGINILATMGHHEENLEHSLQGDYARVMSIDGVPCWGSFCPRDERFREDYVRPVYELLAGAGPDYIWIDDDVRLANHMPISYGCFCDGCLGAFAEEAGREYDRDEVRAAFDEGAVADKLAVRKAWLGHNRTMSCDFLRFIEQSVHRVAPRVALGFMDGSRFYEGYPMQGWAESLAGEEGVEVMWRPGGGNYTEEVPDGAIGKAHELGQEAAWLPKWVRSIESELESFSYQRLKKSEQYTALEAGAYIAAGCTGTAFNVLSMYDEPIDEYEPLVARLAGSRGFLDLMVRAMGRNAPVGMYTGWNADSFAVRNLSEGRWLEGNEPGPGVADAAEIFKIGIPAAYKLEHAKVTALSGDAVMALSDEEIETVLSRGVYMDGAALGRLNERGYEELTGFAVAGTREMDCIEQLLGHELNGEGAGRWRDGRQSFWKGTAYELEPAGEGAEILARLVDYRYEEIGACTAGVFENRLGGRICVAGYYPWEHLQYRAKTRQLKAIMRWLTRDRLGCYVESYHRVVVWDRPDEEGRHAVGLINAYLDAAEDVELMLRTERGEVTFYDMDGARTVVQAEGGSGPYRRFVLPRIDPWHVGLVWEE